MGVNRGAAAFRTILLQCISAAGLTFPDKMLQVSSLLAQLDRQSSIKVKSDMALTIVDPDDVL